MNLYMEMISLGVAVASCLSAFFGMNLTTGLEDHPFAFYITLPLLIIVSVLSTLFCIYRFRAITHSDQVPDYPVLKDMFRYYCQVILYRFLFWKKFSCISAKPLVVSEISNHIMKDYLPLALCKVYKVVAHKTGEMCFLKSAEF